MFTSRESPSIMLCVLTKENWRAVLWHCLYRQNNTTKKAVLFPCTYVYVFTSEDETTSDVRGRHVFQKTRLQVTCGADTCSVFSITGLQTQKAAVVTTSRCIEQMPSNCNRDVSNKWQATAIDLRNIIKRHRAIVFTNQSCKLHHQFRSLLNRFSSAITTLKTNNPARNYEYHGSIILSLRLITHRVCHCGGGEGGGNTGKLYGVPDALNSTCFMVIYKILLSGNRAGLLIPGFLPCLPAQL